MSEDEVKKCDSCGRKYLLELVEHQANGNYYSEN